MSQLCGLERRVSRSGKDSIDHGRGGHDDLANAVAGVADMVASGPGSYSLDNMASGLARLTAHSLGVGGGSIRTSPIPPVDREAARREALEKLEKENERLKRDGDEAFRRYVGSGGRLRW